MSCLYTEVMLPLLVNLAILICLCVDPAKMCLVHPLVATPGNIRWVCKELALQFPSSYIKATFSPLRDRWPGGQACPEGAVGKQQTTSTHNWAAPGWAASHRAVHCMSFRDWWYNHTTALRLHPFLQSCHLKLLGFHGTQAKFCKFWLWFIFPSVPLMPEETTAAICEALAFRAHTGGKTPNQGRR